MYELQLFNPPTGRYVPNVKGENISDLRDLGRLISEGDGFRIVNLDQPNEVAHETRPKQA